MEKWENPAVGSEGLSEPHVRFPEERVSLGGKWRFLPLKQGQTPPQGWETPDFDDKKWSRIPVPGMWEPDIDAQVGLYRRNFTLSGSPGQRQTILELEYTPDTALVWVNGQYVGMNKGAGACAEMDITSALRPEKNTLAMLVTSSNLPGFRVRSGLVGDVGIYMRPSRCITDLKTEVRWQQDGSPLLLVRLAVRGGEGITARIALMEGNRVKSHCESRIIAGKAEAVLECPDVQLWSSRSPALYRVAAVLWDGASVQNHREVSVGFRRLCLDQGGLTLNGEREKLFGAWYRPFDPETGGLLSGQQMEQDLSALREHNFNTVLLTFPGTEVFYSLCDRLGLYVMDASGYDLNDGNREMVREHCRRLSAGHGAHPCIVSMEKPMNATDVLSAENFAMLNNPTPGIIRNTREAALCHFTHLKDAIQCVQAIRETSAICGGVWGYYRGDEKNCCVSSTGAIMPWGREMKQALGPFSFEYREEILTIHSHDPFPRAGKFRYQVTRDGEIVTEKALEVSVTPGETLQVPLETRYDVFRPGRHYLTVQFLDDGSGKVSAWGQWPIGYLKHIYDENPGGAIREEAGSILMRSKDASFTLTKGMGILEQIFTDQTELLASALYPVFIEKVPEGFHLPDQWETLTTRRKWKPSVLEVDHLTRTVTVSFHAGSGMMMNYRLLADGAVTVELRLRTGRTAPKCIGFRCGLKQSLDRYHWFGLGPDGAGDSLLGRFFGIHSQSVEETPAGFKDQVYQLTLTDAAGTGFRVRSEEGLRFECRKEEGNTMLTLLLPLEEAPRPHTTYTFSFTLSAVK